MSNSQSASSSRTSPAKRKLHDPLSEQQSKRRGIPLPSKAKAKKRQDVYHLKRDAIPEDAEGFKVCPYALSYIHVKLISMRSGSSGDPYSDSSRCYHKHLSSRGPRLPRGQYV